MLPLLGRLCHCHCNRCHCQSNSKLEPDIGFLGVDRSAFDPDQGSVQDTANEKGGKWVMTLTAKDDTSRMDEMWELLLLAMIGEYLDDGSTETGKESHPEGRLLLKNNLEQSFFV